MHRGSSKNENTASKALPCGFALIATIFIMVLLVMIALAMLSLSTIETRSNHNTQAVAEAQANARLALMLAIGRLQSEVGPDQRITAPSAILDTAPETEELDGVNLGHLTGVWNARQETLDETPDYTREPSFRRWLVSNSDEAQAQSLSFATEGVLSDPVDMAPGNTPDADPVRAGRISSANGGRLAWWVADENSKALVNPRDELEREDDATVADLLAGFASPGPHGMQALTDFADFPANTPTSDKLVTRNTLELIDPHDGDGQRFFHDISPYPQSVLASVTRGGLRQDLSLYLERNDIDWSHPWGRAEGATGPPQAPLGPNDMLSLGDPLRYDVLPWKTLYHWSRMHRVQMGNRKNLPLNAILSTTPAPDPISNPGWNNGNLRLSPVLVRKQALISFGTQRIEETDDYRLYLYSYPVLTLWNPYNVPLRVEGWHCATASLPLENTIYKNGVKHDLGHNPARGIQRGLFVWGWRGAVMYCNAIGGAQPAVTLAPGEARLFSHDGAVTGAFGQYEMDEAAPTWLPTKPGRGHYLGTINAKEQDRITIGSALATWEVSGDILNGTSLGGNLSQMTFEVRAEPRPTHIGHQHRFTQQMFSSQVAWRHEASNPKINTISQWNLPNSTLRDFNHNPTPFLLLDVRLKPLDDTFLPNKNWLHNIPAHPFAAATSTTKHSRSGVDEATTFFAHPYNVTFKQVNNVEGVFQNRPFFGSSNRPGGQERIVSTPIPLAPITSLAQLQNLPLLPMDSLNWSNYYFQNLAIGNSFASPGLYPDEVQRRSFPFHLGKYVQTQGGDAAGDLYQNVSWFVNDDYTTDHAPARTVDRSYVANHLLFDDYFFSSMAAQEGPVFRQYGSEHSLRDVVSNFYNGTKPLPVAAYRPYRSAGTDSSTAAVDLLMDGANPTTDAHLKAAANLIAEGGFNINSTSVPAWTAVLSAARKKRPVSMPGGSELRDHGRGSQVISRNPNPVVADDSEDSRWLGYRELTDTEIRELAEAVVRQVKKRGPFRSLGEFVNRRLTTDEDLALYGALQAALEDPEVSINADYQGNGKEIKAADIEQTNYPFPAAALGSRYQGTPVYINQADILTPIAPIIQARSDTFVVRGYGESVSPDGTRVLARAWCEAVVQRVADYLEATADAPEVPQAAIESSVNRSFGRRFVIKGFRWLSSPNVS
ncbi:MAG: hypothetical protein QMB90_01460 [Rubritalea sp.]